VVGKMAKSLNAILIILIILGLFYIGDKIVEVTKKNPDEKDAELVGRGLAEAGKEAGKTIIEIVDHVMKENTTVAANKTTPTPAINLT